MLLTQCNAVVEVSNPSMGTDKPGIYADIDFDAGELLGRATLWATGECDMEALYSTTGNSIFQEHYTFRSEGELDTGLRQFFLKLKRSSEPAKFQEE